MYQNKKLATIVLRNEDWLISKILNSASNYKQPGYTSLINHSWRQTVKEFSDALLIHSEKTQIYTGNPILSLIENNDFTEFSKNEAERCYQRSIQPHIYLAFVKIIRKAYEELIFNSRLSLAEKKDFIVFLHHSFDCLEIAFVNSYNDIEKEKQIAKRNCDTSDKNNLFEIIFENVAIPLLLLDPFHRAINHNRAATKLFPFLFINENKSNKIPLDFDEKDLLNSKIDEFRISKHKEALFEAELRLHNTNFYFAISLRKISDSDNILAGFFDLTKWKNLEINLDSSLNRAEESDKLKTAFLANMGHEIRTPMNAIVGFSELLTMSNPSLEERNEYLCLIKKSSNDLLNIIEDIIDIAKIEAKQLKISPKNTSLFELFTELELIYSEVLKKFEKQNVKLLINVNEKEKALECRIDAKRLKQVLSNLIGNAIKFTDKGHIEIGYKLAENKIIYFFVKDTGIGIPNQMQKKVFEQFFQVQEASHINTNGTGLGLSISKNIINLMGGNIWVTSKPDVGSNFYFYLPYIPRSEKITPFIREKESIEGFPDLSKYCILIAEDEETNFLYLRESLKRTGIQILWAKNGLEVINIAESDSGINLILMDIKMPEISGLEATRYITHLKPGLPIIALTAFAMDNDRQACIDAGCIDFLPKPITQGRLISALRKYLTRTGKEAVNLHMT